MPRSANLWMFLCFALAPAATAEAQDFGRDWLDRVTHEMMQDESPLSEHPAHFRAALGELISYDSNIFLEDTNKNADAIFTTYGLAGVTYAQPNWDAEADLAINYNAYADNSDSNGDEERFFGRIRYQGSKVTLQIAEILRRESSPIDVVFVDRVQRLLSNTSPLLVYRATEAVAFELQSDIQFVHFNRNEFQNVDNLNTRSALTIAYKTPWNDLEAVLQGGFFTIDYDESTAPPDAQGFFARLGGRGELRPGLNVIALVGVTSAESDDFAFTTINVEHSTMDIEIHIAHTANENLTLYADYSRRIGFAAEGAPFQVIDSADLIAQIALRDDFTLRARLQYDRVHGPLITHRSYVSAGAAAEYRIMANVRADAGVTYRVGNAAAARDAGDFENVIFSLGVAVTFN